MPGRIATNHSLQPVDESSTILYFNTNTTVFCGTEHINTAGTAAVPEAGVACIWQKTTPTEHILVYIFPLQSDWSLFRHHGRGFAS